jgi:hypothetical protein
MSKWTYQAMYKWYTKQGKIRNTNHEIVYAIIYDAKKPAKKLVGKVEPFIKRNIIYVGESPLQDKSLYPNDLYLVYDDNASGKQWLYFVYPTTKNAITFGNHLSFCYDKTDKNKPCHFHSTTYDCQGPNDFTYRNVKDYFPDKLQLPNDDRNIIKHPFHTQQRTFILDLMKCPWMPIKGGATLKKGQTHRPILNTGFCEIWEEHKIKSMSAIGFRHGEDITFSISIYKGRTANNRVYDAYIFQ